jgi:ribonuclease G
MLSKIIIYADKEKTYTYAYNQKEQLEYYLIDPLKSLNHGIFLAKIINIHSKNNLAWINYMDDKIGVINLPKGHSLQSGSQIICQMTWEGNTDKLPKFSSEIKFAGKYVILLSNPEARHVYAKGLLEHKKLAGIIHKYHNLGLIFRSSINLLIDLDLLEQEIELLQSKMDLVKAQNGLGQLQDGILNYIELLHRYSENLNVVTNSQDIFDNLKQYINLWQIDELTLDNKLRVPTLELSNTFTENNGVRFSLHTLAGINLIDIDSGDSNLSFYKVNFLVLEDVVKNIKLHDLSGIILIDFIKDMSSQEQGKIIDKLKSLLYDDWRRNKVLGFTNAGLCEIIRSK